MQRLELLLDELNLGSAVFLHPFSVFDAGSEWPELDSAPGCVQLRLPVPAARLAGLQALIDLRDDVEEPRDAVVDLLLAGRRVGSFSWHCALVGRDELL